MTEILMRKLSKQVTMTVTVRLAPEFKVRYLLFRLLIRLATWIMGMGVEFKTDGEAH